MSKFVQHTLDSAPQGSRQVLQTVKKQLGFIPNLLGVLAESPATLEAYQRLNTLFEQTSFTVPERQLILLSICRFRNSCYCLAAHGTDSNKLKIHQQIIADVYFNQPINDSKLEAIRTITYSVLETDGKVGAAKLKAFYQAGFQKQHVLEIILAISLKTLSNYVNHINDTPIDAEFISGIPGNQHVES